MQPTAPTPLIERDAEGNALRPMSSGLMFRLFAVPALIVAVVITCAVIVTLGFGWIGVGQQKDIHSILDKLAAGTGERVAGIMLLPKEKELWQAAQELSNRLQEPDKEIPADQRPAVAGRLIDILERTLALKPYSEATRGRISFMSIALGRLGRPEAIPQFELMLQSDHAEIRAAGLKGMAWLGAAPEMRNRTGIILPVLADDPSPEVRLLAAATLGQVSRPDDEKVIAALRDRLVDENDVRWNAALALLRLGDMSGRDDVLEMLDRAFWQEQQVRPDPHSDARRPITEQEISRNIRSALEYVGTRQDERLEAAVRQLTQDRNVDIAKAAQSALIRLRGAASASGGA